MRIDPACPSAVAALEHDPFYKCITAELAGEQGRRGAALAQYFNYAIRQGERIGRVVRLADAARGVAVWTLPQRGEVREHERMRKEVFLRAALGEIGSGNYRRIVSYMSDRADPLVGSDAWYLSIIAVAPQWQGAGLGARLLAPTLAEADEVRAVCYLETFTPRTLSFYQRMGFIARAEFAEPTTRARYCVMVRNPP